MTVLFLTGAGISANAGIPTYRDGGSSWKDKDLEKKSTATRYGNHLAELWDKHWGPIGLQMESSEPTYAHKAIAEFQKKIECIVATQNIDILHEKAGTDNVAHVHGKAAAICMRCHSEDIEKYSGNGAPKCLNCDSNKTRPNVILFGEQLNKKLMKGLESFAQHPDTTDIIAVGTSLNVWPAAALAFDNIAKVTIINIDPTPMDNYAKAVYNVDCDTVIGEVLNKTLEKLI